MKYGSWRDAGGREFALLVLVLLARLQPRHHLPCAF